jgi:hypothetical protein
MRARPLAHLGLQRKCEVELARLARVTQLKPPYGHILQPSHRNGFGKPTNYAHEPKKNRTNQLVASTCDWVEGNKRDWRASPCAGPFRWPELPGSQRVVAPVPFSALPLARPKRGLTAFWVAGPHHSTPQCVLRVPTDASASGTLAWHGHCVGTPGTLAWRGCKHHVGRDANAAGTNSRKYSQVTFTL